MPEYDEVSEAFEEEPDILEAPMDDMNVEYFMVGIDDVVPNDYNPNVMDDQKFNVLVERIRKQGFKHPIEVTPHTMMEGKWTIVNGEHRWRACKFLGYETIKAYKTTAGSDRERKVETVQDNLVRGDNDKVKLTKLIQEMDEPLDQIATDMGYRDELELAKQLVQAKVDDKVRISEDEREMAKKEMNLINNVSMVINDIFTKYGETAPYGFIYFYFGTKMQLTIQCDSKLQSAVKTMAEYCKSTKRDISPWLAAAINDKMAEDLAE